MTTLAAQLYAAEVARHEAYRDLADPEDTMSQLTPEEIAAIEARAEAATPGPWRWRGNLSGKHLDLRSLTSGLPIVMIFRRWGMQSAAPWFREVSDEDRANGWLGVMRFPRLIPSASHNAWDIVAIDHPDARFIEHSRSDVPRLIAHIRALEAENARLAVLADGPDPDAAAEDDLP